MKFSKILKIASISILAIAYAKSPENFSAAKKILKSEFLDIFKSTIYCDCKIDVNFKTSKLLCHNFSENDIAITWEHIVPASKLAYGLGCWNEKICYNEKTDKYYGGRKCCQKISSEFRQREALLYNIVPAINKANNIRSNYDFQMPENFITQQLFCDLHINHKKKLCTITNEKLGLIARTYLKVHEMYNIGLTKTEIENFNKISKKHPISQWESRRDARIKEIIFRD